MTPKKCGHCRGKRKILDPNADKLTWVTCPTCGGSGEEPEEPEEPARPALSDQQARVLRYMGRFFAEHQRMPSLRDLMAELGATSPNGVKCHLDALVKKEYLTQDEGLARGYQIVGLSELIAPVVSQHVAALLGSGA